MLFQGPQLTLLIFAVQTETGVRRETASNDLGYYEFPLLPVGSYRLEAEKQGFKRSSTAIFSLNAGTRRAHALISASNSVKFPNPLKSSPPPPSSMPLQQILAWSSLSPRWMPCP